MEQWSHVRPPRRCSPASPPHPHLPSPCRHASTARVVNGMSESESEPSRRWLDDPPASWEDAPRAPPTPVERPAVRPPPWAVCSSGRRAPGRSSCSRPNRSRPGSNRPNASPRRRPGVHARPSPPAVPPSPDGTPGPARPVMVHLGSALRRGSRTVATLHSPRPPTPGGHPHQSRRPTDSSKPSGTTARRRSSPVSPSALTR